LIKRNYLETRNEVKHAYSTHNKLNKLLTRKNKIIVKYENEDDVIYFTIVGSILFGSFKSKLAQGII
jgi:hypothetical protein